MMCENDKLNIPQEYLNMSATELKAKKEKVYKQIKNSVPVEDVKQIEKKEGVTFNI